MFYYMFGMDAARPEESAKRLADLGISAVVCPAERRCIDAVTKRGMRAFTSVGAFSLRDGDSKCLDADGIERIWFGSGCPCDEAPAARRGQALQSLCAEEGLSGVLSDGMRFASPASPEGIEGFFTCFCPNCRRRMSEMGIDPDALRRDVRDWRDGIKKLPPKEWLQFRRRVIEDAFRRFAREIPAPLTAGAFVFPPSLGALVGQTPSAFESLSMLAPMLYRRYQHSEGPATLNHEYAALENCFGSDATRSMTGVAVPENVLENGFPPQQIEAEVRAAREGFRGTLAPILQLDDDLLAESVSAARSGGADGIGFFMYDERQLRRLERVL